MKDSFKSHWEKSNIPTDKPIYLAISGGVDSVILFHLLRLSQISFTALHCNFNLRDVDSDLDEDFIKQLCETFSIPLKVKQFDTKLELKQKGKGVQEIARDLRYHWFNSVIKPNNGLLLTAHHANDSIETALFNFIRGTDIKGLGGIRPTNTNLFRPLLPFTKTEIYEFAKSEGFTFREDVSNSKNDYSRNIIRNKIVPELKNIFPNLEKRALHTIRSAQEHYNFIEHQLEAIKKELFISKPTGIWISKSALKAKNLSPFILVELFKDFGFTDETFFKNLFNLQTGKQKQSENHRFIIDRDFFIIALPKPITEIHTIDCEEMLKLNNTKLNIQTENCTLQPEWCISLDTSKIEFPLCLRTWTDGDYFFPEGMKGKKKLKDFYRDSKFSIPEKEQQWILCDKNHILWIIGKRKDKRSLSLKTDKNTLNLVWNENN